MEFLDMFKCFISQKNKTIHFGKGTESVKKWILKDLESGKSLEEIESKIISRHSKTARDMMLDYYTFMKEKYSIDYETGLNEVISINNETERILELIKLVHEKKSRDELMYELGVQDSTFSEDLKKIRDGFTLLGNTIKLDLKSRTIDGQKCYISDSTCHPIFLPLNLTEIYALTVYLPTLLKKSYDNNASLEIINNIVSRVRAQLSDYALEIIDNNREENIEYDYNYPTSFVSEKDQMSNKEWLYMNLMKSHRKCKFIGKDGETYVGYLYNHKTIKTEDFQDIRISDIDNFEIIPM